MEDGNVISGMSVSVYLLILLCTVINMQITPFCI